MGCQEPEIGRPRRSPRIELDAEALVRRSGGHRYRIRLFDLSRHGCKVEFAERPTLEEKIWIKIEGLDGLEGLVRWTDGFIVGVDFLRPMHAAVFDHVVKRLS
jgi:hypothetical protein